VSGEPDLAIPGERPSLHGLAGRPRHLGVSDTLTRSQLAAYNVVAAQPGCTQAQVAFALRVTHQTASFHLLALARLGLIAQVRDGRILRHFPGPAMPRAGVYLEALLRDPRKARLLRFLAHHPVERLTVNELSKRAGVVFGFAKRTLWQLHHVGLVTLERRNYQYLIRVSDELRRLVLAQDPEQA
jgi:DNA-binding transcriptional ArsR family regulator